MYLMLIYVCLLGSDCQVRSCHSESWVCPWTSEAVPSYWKWCKSVRLKNLCN